MEVWVLEHRGASYGKAGCCKTPDFVATFSFSFNITAGNWNPFSCHPNFFINFTLFLPQGETTFFWVVLALAEFLWLLLAAIALFTWAMINIQINSNYLCTFHLSPPSLPIGVWRTGTRNFHFLQKIWRDCLLMFAKNLVPEKVSEPIPALFT